MSTVSKVTFGIACISSAGIIVWVHYQQIKDRERMHRGVLRDINTQEMKRRQNIHELNQQQALTKMLRDKEETVKERL